MFIIETGIKDLTLKKLPQTIADNKLHLDVVEGAITMNDEADDIRLQRFIHKPTQPGGKKWLEDEDEIGVIYGATFRAYSTLHELLQSGVPGCKCDEKEYATFNLDDCRQTKTCTGNNAPIGCSCADNGPIQTGECKCSQLFHPDGYTPVKYFDKYQEFPCLCTQQPLKDISECICPSNDLAFLPCICSTTLESNPQDCTIKHCLANSDTTVTKYSCY
ncbi:MAG: hypothetical protein EZS28_002384 [Streblomastix strix]|uniref:Uncharacterized protein n=1 Tax=Streblomastix strix TaxID=222440 RepID=A0A5J4X4C8_9EUKA|nr:MAG: hypothetical protein EZS28_002384 [Streblomastix strix]